MGGTSYLEKELTKGRRVVPRNERKYITQGPKGRACGIEWKGVGEPGLQNLEMNLISSGRGAANVPGSPSRAKDEKH